MRLTKLPDLNVRTCKNIINTTLIDLPHSCGCHCNRAGHLEASSRGAPASQESGQCWVSLSPGTGRGDGADGRRVLFQSTCPRLRSWGPGCLKARLDFIFF